LVYERNVHIALGVLDHLGGFRDTDAGGLVGTGAHDGGIELIDEIRHFGCRAGGHLADGGEAVLLVARVDALGAVAGEEVAVEFESRHPLQYRHADLLGATGVDGRLVDHHRAALEHRAHRLAGTHEGPEIGPLVAVDRGRHGDDENLAAPETLQLGGEGQVLRRLELRRCNLERDVASPAQLSYPLRVHVEADGLVLLAKLDRQRQADVAQPHHPDARPAPLRPHPSALSAQTPARCTSGAGGSRTAGVSGSSLAQRHRPPLSLVMSASIASWASSSSGVATSTASGAAGRTGTRAPRAPSTPRGGAPCSVRASALCPPVIAR